MNTGGESQQNNNGSYKPQNDGFMELEVAAPVLIKEAVSSYHTYPITG